MISQASRAVSQLIRLEFGSLAWVGLEVAAVVTASQTTLTELHCEIKGAEDMISVWDAVSSLPTLWKHLVVFHLEASLNPDEICPLLRPPLLLEASDAPSLKVLTLGIELQALHLRGLPHLVSASLRMHLGGMLVQMDCPCVAEVKLLYWAHSELHAKRCSIPFKQSSNSSHPPLS